MACCTYLRDDEFERFKSVSDKDLNELFQEVRNTIDDKLFLQEREFIIKKRFRKPTKVFRYTLYKQLRNDCEVQVINFAGGKSSINGLVDSSYIMTYFYGLINGRNIKNNKDLFN
jgi:hypothetical protein